MFSSGMRESTQQARALATTPRARALVTTPSPAVQTIAIDGVPAEVFVALLDHLYTDSTEVAAEMALPLFAAADRFGVERLKLHCASRLESGLSIEDACAVLSAADRHQAHELREQCVAFIVSHFREVHTTEGFRELPRELLQVVHSAISSRLCPSGEPSGQLHSPSGATPGQAATESARIAASGVENLRVNP